jgi:hypothetical protein
MIVRIAAAGLLLAVLATGAEAGRREQADARSVPRTITLRGHVSGLYPGAKVWLPLVLRNPNKIPLTIQRITTRVGNAAPGCPSTFLRVRPFDGSLRVPARGTAQASLKVRLRRKAPDACQGARFPLTFTAEGSSS